MRGNRVQAMNHLIDQQIVNKPIDKQTELKLNDINDDKDITVNTMTKSYPNVQSHDSSEDVGPNNESHDHSEIVDEELYDLLKEATNDFTLTFTEAIDRDEFKAYPLSSFKEGKIMRIINEARKKMTRVKREVGKNKQETKSKSILQKRNMNQKKSLIKEEGLTKR